MKTLTLTIITLILIIVASSIAIGQESNSYTLKTFVIDGNKEHTQISPNNIKTFTISQKPTGKSALIGIKKGSKCARERNRIYQQREEEIEKCIKKITKNWKRTYYKNSYEKEYDDEKEEWITTNVFHEKEKEFSGYDKDEDTSLRFKLRNRALNGEKIC